MSAKTEAVSGVAHCTMDRRIKGILPPARGKLCDVSRSAQIFPTCPDRSDRHRPSRTPSQLHSSHHHTTGGTTCNAHHLTPTPTHNRWDNVQRASPDTNSPIPNVQRASPDTNSDTNSNSSAGLTSSPDTHSCQAPKPSPRLSRSHPPEPSRSTP